MAGDLLDGSAEQVREVIDSDDDILDIEVGERMVSSKSSGYRPLPPFWTVADKFGDFDDLAMQGSEHDKTYHLGKAKLT